MTSDHDGGCDCYVQGSVANSMGSVEAQTALKKRELRTTWEEGLVLPLAEEELPTATLTLTLRTCDRFSRHSVVGELRLGLDGVSVPLGRPRPLGLLSLHPSHPPAPAQKCHRGRASRWICWGGERSLVEQRKASRARLRWFGGGEEQGDRRLASVWKLSQPHV